MFLVTFICTETEFNSLKTRITAHMIEENCRGGGLRDGDDLIVYRRGSQDGSGAEYLCKHEDLV